MCTGHDAGENRIIEFIRTCHLIIQRDVRGNLVIRVTWCTVTQDIRFQPLILSRKNCTDLTDLTGTKASLKQKPVRPVRSA